MSSSLFKKIFGEELKKEPYKLVPHAFQQNTRIGKPVCKHCGLAQLRNPFT